MVSASNELACLGEGQAQYGAAVSSGYSKVDLTNKYQYFEDAGQLVVARTCPTQLHTIGSNKFRAR